MGKKKISNKNKKQENFERDNFLRRGLFDGKEQIKKWPLAALFLTAEHWLILRCPIQKTLSSMRILDITGFVHFLQMKVKIQQPQGFMNRAFSIRLGALYVPPLFPPPPAQLSASFLFCSFFFPLNLQLKLISNGCIYLLRFILYKCYIHNPWCQWPCPFFVFLLHFRIS